MSGRTKAALSASACTPRPKSQTMYLTRTSPMMRERNVDTMSTTVAEKMLCAWEGCRRRHERAPTVSDARRLSFHPSDKVELLLGSRFEGGLVTASRFYRGVGAAGARIVSAVAYSVSMRYCIRRIFAWLWIGACA